MGNSLVNLFSYSNQLLFQLFVTWKTLSLNDIKEKYNTFSANFLEILKLLEAYIDQNLIIVESNKLHEPFYHLQENEKTQQLVNMTIENLKMEVEHKFDFIGVNLDSSNWKTALNDWEELQKLWKPIVDNFYYNESLILRKKLYKKARKKFNV